MGEVRSKVRNQEWVAALPATGGTLPPTRKSPVCIARWHGEMRVPRRTSSALQPLAPQPSSDSPSCCPCALAQVALSVCVWPFPVSPLKNVLLIFENFIHAHSICSLLHPPLSSLQFLNPTLSLTLVSFEIFPLNPLVLI